MIEYRYILEPYKGIKSRHRCPACNDSGKSFVRYVDKFTLEYISEIVGRCNRESKCAYHYTPKQYFRDNNIPFEKQPLKIHYQPEPIEAAHKEVSFIEISIFKQTLKDYRENNFVIFLISLFGTEVTNRLISTYFIGTSKHWRGATIFWQIDFEGSIRTGKIMLYNAQTGKRVKQPVNHITWVHKILKLPDFKLMQCFFGEHLLRNNIKQVAIVESEKTAIIASVYLPQFIWLAVGSLSNLNAEKCKVLHKRTVVLFPDINGYEIWNAKVKMMSLNIRFLISDLLERKASLSERKQGFDIADYLIRFPFTEFISHKAEDNGVNRTELAIVQNREGLAVNGSKWQSEEVIDMKSEPILALERREESAVTFEKCDTKPEKTSGGLLADVCFPAIIRPSTKCWRREITELEIFFNSISLPTYPIELNQSTTLLNVAKFIDSHFQTIKSNNGCETFEPYLNRLMELKKYLEESNKHTP